MYSLIHVAQIWRSDHSWMRKISLMVESTYNALNLVFAWFSLANFYIFFVSCFQSELMAGDPHQRTGGQRF